MTRPASLMISTPWMGCPSVLLTVPDAENCAGGGGGGGGHPPLLIVKKSDWSERIAQLDAVILVMGSPTRASKVPSKLSPYTLCVAGPEPSKSKDDAWITD